MKHTPCCLGFNELVVHHLIHCGHMATSLCDSEKVKNKLQKEVSEAMMKSLRHCDGGLGVCPAAPLTVSCCNYQAADNLQAGVHVPLV